MMNPMITSEVAKAHREQLRREAFRERRVTEALACDAREAMDRPRLVTRLVVAAHAFLRVQGETAPAEGPM